MKIRILAIALPLLTLLWMCDAPPSIENDDIIYLPFTYLHDTLASTLEMTGGSEPIDWGDRLSAWIGETGQYKSGISADFSFADSSLDPGNADSVQLVLRHEMTFPEDASGTLSISKVLLGVYNTTNQSIDINTANYGSLLTTDSMDVTAGHVLWSFTLPEHTILASDSSISLGVFAQQTGSLSFIQGGASSLRPILTFFYHEPDSAGLDSATSISVVADTLYMHLYREDAAFDPAYRYLTQLSRDSLLVHFDLKGLQYAADTLVHIDSASIELPLNADLSNIYKPDTTTALHKYIMTVEDPVSGLRTEIILQPDSTYLGNDLHLLIQRALDEERGEINLIVRSGHTGYDPGYTAFDPATGQTALRLTTTLAVRP